MYTASLANSPGWKMKRAKRSTVWDHCLHKGYEIKCKLSSISFYLFTTNKHPGNMSEDDSQSQPKSTSLLVWGRKCTAHRSKATSQLVCRPIETDIRDRYAANQCGRGPRIERASSVPWEMLRNAAPMLIESMESPTKRKAQLFCMSQHLQVFFCKS